MPIITAELAILKHLALGEHLVLSDLDTWVPRILGDRDPDEVSDFKQFLQQAADATATDKFKKSITKCLGYPGTIPSVPLLAVVVGSEQEDRRLVGDIVEEGLVDTETGRVYPVGYQVTDEDEARHVEGYTISGSIYAGTYGILIFERNITRLVFIQALVKYLLHYYRASLESVYQFFDQRIMCADLQPSPEFIPDDVFMRRIDFSFKYLNTFEERSPLVVNVDILPTWYDIFGRELVDDE